jgi:hypothetical protein
MARALMPGWLLAVLIVLTAAGTYVTAYEIDQRQSAEKARLEAECRVIRVDGFEKTYLCPDGVEYVW